MAWHHGNETARPGWHWGLPTVSWKAAKSHLHVPPGHGMTAVRLSARLPVDIECDDVGLQRVGFHVLRAALKHGLLHGPSSHCRAERMQVRAGGWTKRIVDCRCQIFGGHRVNLEGEEQTGARLPTSSLHGDHSAPLHLVTRAIVLNCFVGVLLNGPLVDS